MLFRGPDHFVTYCSSETLVALLVKAGVFDELKQLLRLFRGIVKPTDESVAQRRMVIENDDRILLEVE